jgi:hypothetical protein
MSHDRTNGEGIFIYLFIYLLIIQYFSEQEREKR